MRACDCRRRLRTPRPKFDLRRYTFSVRLWHERLDRPIAYRSPQGDKRIGTIEFNLLAIRPPRGPPVHQPKPTSVNVWRDMLDNLSPHDLAVILENLLRVIRVPGIATYSGQ